MDILLPSRDCFPRCSLSKISRCPQWCRIETPNPGFLTSPAIWSLIQDFCVLSRITFKISRLRVILSPAELFLRILALEFSHPQQGLRFWDLFSPASRAKRFSPPSRFYFTKISCSKVLSLQSRHVLRFVESLVKLSGHLEDDSLFPSRVDTLKIVKSKTTIPQHGWYTEVTYSEVSPQADQYRGFLYRSSLFSPIECDPTD